MIPRIIQMMPGQGKMAGDAVVWVLANDGHVYALERDSRGHRVWERMPGLPANDSPAVREDIGTESQG